MNILVLHGINLNMFGKRDPKQYGTATLQDIDNAITELAGQLGAHVQCFQTNYEGAMCERIHQALADKTDAIVINAGAWTHYSYAVRDTVELMAIPVVEVHLSNVDEREDWRRVSVIADLVAARVVGKGPDGYREALEILAAEQR